MLFRDWLARLEAEGELREIKSAISPDLEAGALAALSNANGGAALLMRNLSEHPGAALASGLFAGPGTLRPTRAARTPWGRLCTALGLARDMDYETLMEELLARLDYRIKPVLVGTGPCKEVVRQGSESTVEHLPIPRIYAGDGGPYLTGSFVAIREPDTGWLNWSVQRVMRHDAHTLVVDAPPTSHLGRILATYARRGEHAPCAVVLGGDPASFVAAAYPAPFGVGQAELAGGLAQAPINVVRTEGAGLLVPSDAEVVIEGDVAPGDRLPEGPFPLDSGYSESALAPAIRVRCITERRDPIIPFVAPAVKVSDMHALQSVLLSAFLLGSLRRETQLQVRWVSLPVEARLGLCVAACTSVYTGHNFWVTNYLLRHKATVGFKKILLVDPDVDAADLYEIVNDWAQKTDPRPGRGYHVERAPHPPDGAGVITWDATTPSKQQRRLRVSFETSFPTQIQQRALALWERADLPPLPTGKRGYAVLHPGDRDISRFQYATDEFFLRFDTLESRPSGHTLNVLFTDEMIWKLIRADVALEPFSNSVRTAVIDTMTGLERKTIYLRITEILSDRELLGMTNVGPDIQ